VTPKALLLFLNFFQSFGEWAPYGDQWSPFS